MTTDKWTAPNLTFGEDSRVQVYPDDPNSWVELVDFMPHPASGVSGDLAIVNAARVSFLGESKGKDSDAGLLSYLMRHKHTSPFEMVEFKFRVNAPLIVWWQWARHRTWNFNAQSGRYTAFDENDFYIPAVWRKQSKDNKQGSGTEELSVSQQIRLLRLLLRDQKTKDNAHGLFDNILSDDISEYGEHSVTPVRDMLERYIDAGYDVYQRLLDAGVAREQARLFLPAFGVYYTWVVKTDAHNLMNFLRLRLAKDAQYEIRAYAEVIHEKFFRVALPETERYFSVSMMYR